MSGLRLTFLLAANMIFHCQILGVLILMGKPLPFCFVLFYIVTFSDEIPRLNKDLVCKGISAVHQPHTTSGDAVI